MEWISVKDQTPTNRWHEAWDYYIACVDGLVAPVIYYFDGRWRTCNHEPITGIVTHWMPLPASPKE